MIDNNAVSHQAVVSPSSGSCQAVVRQLSGSCQAVIRQLLGSCQAIFRRLSGSCLVVVRILACLFCFRSLKNVINLPCLRSVKTSLVFTCNAAIICYIVIRLYSTKTHYCAVHIWLILYAHKIPRMVLF